MRWTDHTFETVITSAAPAALKMLQFFMLTSNAKVKEVEAALATTKRTSTRNRSETFQRPCLKCAQP